MQTTSTIWPQSVGQPTQSPFPLQNRVREKEKKEDEVQGQQKDQHALEHGEELDMVHKWQYRVVEPGPRQK